MICPNHILSTELLFIISVEKRKIIVDEINSNSANSIYNILDKAEMVIKDRIKMIEEETITL